MRRGIEGRGERGRVGVMKNVGREGKRKSNRGGGEYFFYVRLAKDERKDERRGGRTRR